MIATLVDTAHAFALEELRPVALEYDESEEFPHAQLRRAAELGLTCYDLPREYGGGGVESLEESVRVLEELTWGDSPITMAITQAAFSRGRPRARQRGAEAALAPPLCGADPPAVAVAITEPGAGSDAASIATEAKHVDGGYVLSGHKKFIGNANIADRAVVFATVAPARAPRASLRSSSSTATRASVGASGCRRWAAAAFPRQSCISRTASCPRTGGWAAKARDSRA